MEYFLFLKIRGIKDNILISSPNQAKTIELAEVVSPTEVSKAAKKNRWAG